MRKIIFLVVLTMFMQEAAGSIRKEVLPNGLTVLIREDHTSPIVAINMWINVGSVNETDEMTGLAHFQEHMVFKGTEKYGVGEIARMVKAAGGNLNAGTSYSYTMYYVVLPSRSFSLALEVQADAMMHSTFEEGEFKKERIVVIDEARMYDDTPDAYVFYRTMELGFKEHNYRRPIAGYEKIVRRIKRDKLLGFYNNYYRPSNACLVVVGDVDGGRAFEEIKKVYGSWENKATEIYEPPIEPPQDNFRFKEFRGAIDHAYMGIGFHIPDIKHEDYPSLEVLSSLLSSGKSSRLFRNVQENKRLVTTFSSQVLAEKWPGYFQIYSSMPVEKWEQARDAIFEELQRFKVEPIKEDELIKARRQLQKSIYTELETVEGQAQKLGYYQMMGDYRLALEHQEAISRVSAADIMKVAEKYLRLSNCSLVAYLPKKWDHTPATLSDVEKSVASILSGTAGIARQDLEKKSVKTKPSSPGDVDKGARKLKAEPKLLELRNGVRVVVKERPVVPLVALLTVFQGGSRLEEKGKSGLSVLTFRSLLKGSSSYSAETIAREIEGLGGNIESLSTFDISGLYVNVLSENLDKVIPYYRDVLRKPAFPTDEVEKEKDKLIEEFAKRHDNPIMFSIDSLFANVFGEHPYSKPFMGDKEELEKLVSEDCKDLYSRALVSDNIVLVFIGDITDEKAMEVAGKLVGDLPRTETHLEKSSTIIITPRPGMHEFKKKNIKQSMALVGFLAPPMMSKEAVSLEVLNGVLTGLGGRLFVELRDKRSLGYMAGSAFVPLKDKSIFFGYANPTEEGVEEAFSVIMEELGKVASHEVDEEEIKRAKEWLVGTQLMQLQTNLAQAIMYGTYEALGFGYELVEKTPEIIQSVTREDLKKAALEVFKDDRAVYVKLLPDDETGE